MCGADVDVTCHCGEPVAETRRRYCSARCAAVAAAERHTDRSVAAARARVVAEQLPCVVCRERIPPGHRVREVCGARQCYRERAQLHARGRWYVTPHAVDQFVRRVGWERNYRSALGALIDESRGAHFVKRLDTGAELWRGPKPRRLRFIVGAGEGARPALVTVLGSHDRC